MLCSVVLLRWQVARDLTFTKEQSQTDWQGRLFRHLLLLGRSGASDRLLLGQTCPPTSKAVQEVVFTSVVSVIQFTTALQRQRCWLGLDRGWSMQGRNSICKTQLAVSSERGFSVPLSRMPLGSVMELCWSHVDLFKSERFHRSVSVTHFALASPRSHII